MAAATNGHACARAAERAPAQEPRWGAPLPGLQRSSEVRSPDTLEDLLDATWTQLGEAGGSACLACGEVMAPRWSAGAGVVGGRCGGCGSTLE